MKFSSKVLIFFLFSTMTEKMKKSHMFYHTLSGGGILRHIKDAYSALCFFLHSAAHELHGVIAFI
jgi:hypothetical protein